MVLSDILNLKFWGALAALALLIWVLQLRIERDAALAENTSLNLALQSQKEALNLMQREKSVMEKTILNWKEKNEQITRELASTRQKTFKSTQNDSDFGVWGAAALPRAILAVRLVHNQICYDPRPAD